MKLQRRRRGAGAPEQSAATSDIAFLLIIYVMVTAGFTAGAGFLAELPERGSERLIARENAIRFEMDGGGNILYEGRIVGMAGAESRIRAAKRGNPALAAVIVIDGRARWQSVVSFIEIAQGLEIDTFSFSMKKGEP